MILGMVEQFNLIKSLSPWICVDETMYPSSNLGWKHEGSAQDDSIMSLPNIFFIIRHSQSQWVSSYNIYFFMVL
jgi:hypothetical protein